MAAKPPHHTLQFPRTLSSYDFSKVGLSKNAALMNTVGLHLAQGSYTLLDLTMHILSIPFVTHFVKAKFIDSVGRSGYTTT